MEVVENIPFTRVSRGNRVKKKMQFKVGIYTLVNMYFSCKRSNNTTTYLFTVKTKCFPYLIGPFTSSFKRCGIVLETSVKNGTRLRWSFPQAWSTGREFTIVTSTNTNTNTKTNITLVAEQLLVLFKCRCLWLIIPTNGVGENIHNSHSLSLALTLCQWSSNWMKYWK